MHKRRSLGAATIEVISSQQIHVETVEDEHQKWCREATVELLKRGWPLGEESKYDTNHALVLCRMHGFTPGLRFLFERMRLFREVLQVGLSGLWCTVPRLRSLIML